MFLLLCPSVGQLDRTEPSHQPGDVLCVLTKTAACNKEETRQTNLNFLDNGQERFWLYTGVLISLSPTRKEKRSEACQGRARFRQHRDASCHQVFSPLQGKASKEIPTILAETLVFSFLVGLRTYQHPCINLKYNNAFLRNSWPYKKHGDGTKYIHMNARTAPKTSLPDDKPWLITTLDVRRCLQWHITILTP